MRSTIKSILSSTLLLVVITCSSVIVKQKNYEMQ